MKDKIPSCIEKVLLKRIKVIGENEQTYLGYPEELTKLLREEIITEIQKMADKVPPNLLLNEIVGNL